MGYEGSLALRPSSDATSASPSRRLSAFARFRQPVACLFATAVWFAAATSNAITFNTTFDSSVTSRPDAAQWINGWNTATAEFQANFSDPINVNILFKANPGASILGQSLTHLQFIGGGNGYSQMKAIMAADAKTPDDATSVSSFPLADPTGGRSFIASFAEAKALGIRPNDLTNDGTIMMGAGFTYAFPPGRSAPGAIDFVGVAEHEISEVMGRIGILGNTLGTGRPLYDPLDLFGYTGSGALNLSPNQPGVYFSIDGGNTLLKLYNNGSNGGDNKDWASGSNDSFNAFSTSSVVNRMTTVDLREMDVIGWDRIVPEPGSFVLLGLGAIGLGIAARRRRKT